MVRSLPIHDQERDRFDGVYLRHGSHGSQRRPFALAERAAVSIRAELQPNSNLDLGGYAYGAVSYARNNGRVLSARPDSAAHKGVWLEHICRRETQRIVMTFTGTEA